MKMDQPVDPPLYIKYTPETDTLVLSGVGPVLGSYGDTVARDLVAFTNEAGDEVVGGNARTRGRTAAPIPVSRRRRRPQSIPQTEGIG